MKKLRITLFIFLCSVTSYSCGFFIQQPHRGKMVQAWQTMNNSFRIRVTVYDEAGAFLAGSYYVFESAPINSDQWSEFMVFRHDDQPEIPRDQVRFLSDKAGYAYMGWVFASTTDGGLTWSVWNAARDLPNWRCCNYRLIQNAIITSDGTGSMLLNPLILEGIEITKLVTTDFGQHWSVN